MEKVSQGVKRFAIAFINTTAVKNCGTRGVKRFVIAFSFLRG